MHCTVVAMYRVSTRFQLKHFQRYAPSSNPDSVNGCITSR